MNLSTSFKTLEDTAGSADSKGRVKSEGASSDCGTRKDEVKVNEENFTYKQSNLSPSSNFGYDFGVGVSAQRKKKRTHLLKVVHGYSLRFGGNCFGDHSGRHC
ncbi:unnamed protein product [Trifolium pratense]|uniref:Uncharacterized protein n=1 Tax=Trifolium pratense TaxID=57577 RepID=A0ACB0JSC1_TRIPR|nr:unnamed protein product [Trifolium pratense]